MRQKGTLDADSGICDADTDRAARLAIDADGGTAALGELDRVLDQIAQRMRQAILVASCRDGVVVEFESQPQSFLRSRRLELVEQAADEWDKRHGLRIFRQRTGFEFRVIEQGIKRAQQALASAPHGFEGFVLTGVVDLPQL